MSTAMDWLPKQMTLDTDMTDEAAWKARPEFAARSKARMQKEAQMMSKKVAADKAGIKASSKTVLDTDHTDELAWQARKDLRKQSRDKRAQAEAERKAANRSIFGAIHKTKTSDKIDDDIRGARTHLPASSNPVIVESSRSYSPAHR